MAKTEISATLTSSSGSSLIFSGKRLNVIRFELCDGRLKPGNDGSGLSKYHSNCEGATSALKEISVKNDSPEHLVCTIKSASSNTIFGRGYTVIVKGISNSEWQVVASTSALTVHSNTNGVPPVFSGILRASYSGCRLLNTGGTVPVRDA